MSASLSNVINASLQAPGRSLALDNMNVVTIFTSNDDVLSTAERYKVYSTAAQVSADFGSSSVEAQFANTFFAQTPNAVTAGGALVLGFWRAAAETVAATAGKLTGAQLSEASTLPQLQLIDDGSYNVTVDGGAEETVDSLDFQTATSLEDVLAILNAAAPSGASFTLDDQRFVLTSDTTGTSSEITLLSADESGTFVGNLLALAEGTGAVAEDGAGQETLAAESKVDAVSALHDEVNCKGFMFIDDPTDSEVTALAAWCQANSVLSYDVFSSASNLEVDTTNVVWDNKLKKYTNYRALYRKDADRKMAVGYMSRMHTVNFEALNSAITMQLKELTGVAAEEYTQTELAKAKRVGLDVYTTFKNVPKLLTSGANDFTDNPYNIIAFIDTVQTRAFNLLGTTPTKIAQTRQGVNALVTNVEESCQRFSDANVIGAGEWNLNDSFGNVEIFKENIRRNGYYVSAGSLATQDSASREARNSPAIQTAIKNAGAIHQADIIIYFNL